MTPKFIELNCYYPNVHKVWVKVADISAIQENKINENSKGAVVFTSHMGFHVLEKPTEILETIYESDPAQFGLS